ncbi:ATP synthase F1 subunit epsilon [bacterium]|jgi:F-type H+-transporting ATPase subunit epsilon|nr:ATP synthase F1 subunit epsilon [bacterium]
MKDFTLKIVTPEKVVLTDKVSQVSVTSSTGQITILSNHVPLVSQLAAGEIVVKQQGKEENLMAVFGGFVEVVPGQVIILADRVENVAEIDEDRAEEAKKRAEDALQDKKVDSTEFVALTANLEKEMNRLRIVRKYKHKGIRTGKH